MPQRCALSSYAALCPCLHTSEIPFSRFEFLQGFNVSKNTHKTIELNKSNNNIYNIKKASMFPRPGSKAWILQGWLFLQVLHLVCQRLEWLFALHHPLPCPVPSSHRALSGAVQTGKWRLRQIVFSNVYPCKLEISFVAHRPVCTTLWRAAWSNPFAGRFGKSLGWSMQDLGWEPDRVYTYTYTLLYMYTYTYMLMTIIMALAPEARST